MTMVIQASASTPQRGLSSRLCGRRQRVIFAMTIMMIVTAFFAASAPHRFGISASKNILLTDLGTEPSVCKNECLSAMGADGFWVQDWDFAREHGQYQRMVYPNGPYMALRDNKFRPSLEAPFPWRTSWRWFDNAPRCQIDAMTQGELCEVLGELRISRILFHGDSLSRLMYQAFMNKQSDVHVEAEAEVWSGHINCNVHARGDDETSSSSGRIDVHYERDGGGNPFPNTPRGVYALDNETQGFITSSDEPAMAIFNIGAHYHNFSDYKEDMDKLLGIISGLGRPQDLYFFRSTSPGHDLCEPGSKNFDWRRGARTVPLKSYSEYKVSSQHRYDWDKFESYNDYSEGLIYDHNRKGGDAPAVHFLNIYNMTVLRRDGHYAPTDCLHYHNPGPLDWWNHLLFTYLRHLSAEKNANCRRISP